MTKEELHYLSCQNVNCERFACLARRDYEQRILNIDKQLGLDISKLWEALEKALWCADNFQANSEEWQRKHHEASEIFFGLDRK